MHVSSERSIFQKKLNTKQLVRFFVMHVSSVSCLFQKSLNKKQLVVSEMKQILGLVFLWNFHML